MRTRRSHETHAPHDVSNVIQRTAEPNAKPVRYAIERTPRSKKRSEAGTVEAMRQSVLAIVRNPSRAVCCALVAGALSGCAGMGAVNGFMAGDPIRGTTLGDKVLTQGENLAWQQLSQQRTFDVAQGTLPDGTKVPVSFKVRLIAPTDKSISDELRANCKKANHDKPCAFIEYGGIVQVDKSLSWNVPIAGGANVNASVGAGGVIEYIADLPVHLDVSRLEDLPADLVRGLATDVPVTAEKIQAFAERGGKVTLTVRGTVSGGGGAGIGSSVGAGGFEVGANAGVNASLSESGVYKLSFVGDNGELEGSASKVLEGSGRIGVSASVGVQDKSSELRHVIDQIGSHGTLAHMASGAATSQERSLIEKYFSLKAELSYTMTDTTTHVATWKANLVQHPDVAPAFLALEALDSKPLNVAVHANKAVVVNAGERSHTAAGGGSFDVGSLDIVSGGHDRGSEGGYVRTSKGDFMIYRDVNDAKRSHNFIDGAEQRDGFCASILSNGQHKTGFCVFNYSVDGAISGETGARFAWFLRAMGAYPSTAPTFTPQSSFLGLNGTYGNGKGNLTMYIEDAGIHALASLDDRWQIYVAEARAQIAMSYTQDLPGWAQDRRGYEWVAEWKSHGVSGARKAELEGQYAAMFPGRRLAHDASLPAWDKAARLEPVVAALQKPNAKPQDKLRAVQVYLSGLDIGMSDWMPDLVAIQQLTNGGIVIHDGSLESKGIKGLTAPSSSRAVPSVAAAIDALTGIAQVR
jgi:hypothetical protein